MTPETAKILMDGLITIVAIGGFALVFYVAFKGFFGGYIRGG